MLEKKIYSREQLIKLYHTDRLDAIKKKINREGYKYIDSGRGSSYTMQITYIPQSTEFKDYCINELCFSSRTDFNNLKWFFRFLLSNYDNVKLQYNEMQEILVKQGIAISAQTISNYCKHLQSIGWIHEDSSSYVYYYYDYDIKHNRYITKEQYRKIYKNYWIIYYKHGKSFQQAEQYLCKVYGSKPKKRPLKTLNGIYKSQFNKIKSMIQKG